MISCSAFEHFHASQADPNPTSQRRPASADRRYLSFLRLSIATVFASGEYFKSIRSWPRCVRELLWKFTKRGEFEFACLISEHYEAGMHRKIIVK
jgi:hypothetical protein